MSCPDGDAWLAGRQSGKCRKGRSCRQRRPLRISRELQSCEAPQALGRGLAAHPVERLLEAAGVGLLGPRQRGEPVGDLVEALFAGGLREARVHGGELVGLAGDGAHEVLLRVAHGLVGRRVADGGEEVHVAERVTGLALGGVAEQAGCLAVTLDVGAAREI